MSQGLNKIWGTHAAGQLLTLCHLAESKLEPTARAFQQPAEALAPAVAPAAASEGKLKPHITSQTTSAPSADLLLLCKVQAEAHSARVPAAGQGCPCTPCTTCSRFRWQA